MAVQELSHVSGIAEQHENVADLMTEILAFQPEEGQKLVILPSVKTGDEAGIPIYGKLRDSDGNELPIDTHVVLRYDAPTLNEARAVSDERENIRPYRNLDVPDQQDRDFIDRMKHKLLGRGVIVRHIDEFQVAIESSEVIDWDESELYIDENAIRQVPEHADVDLGGN